MSKRKPIEPSKKTSSPARGVVEIEGKWRRSTFSREKRYAWAPYSETFKPERGNYPRLSVVILPQCQGYVLAVARKASAREGWVSTALPASMLIEVGEALISLGGA
mgnify:CR=1 FL=1